MISAIFSLFCKSVSHNQLTNNVSISEILEELNSEKLPASFNEPSVFIILFKREHSDPEKSKFIIKISNNKHKIYDQEVPMDFQGKFRLRNEIHFNNFPILEHGLLLFEVFHNNKLLTSYPVEINKGQKNSQKLPELKQTKKRK